MRDEACREGLDPIRGEPASRDMAEAFRNAVNRKRLVRPEGLELSTLGLEGPVSNLQPIRCQ